MLAILMGVLDAETVNQLAELIISTARPVAIYLFGSHTTGQATAESDLDVFVVVSDEITDTRRLASRIRLAIAEIVEMPCDVLVEQESTFSERKQLPTLERTIAVTGVPLYAA